MVLGALAALAAALFWAIAASWFSKMGRFMRPAEINFFKGALALFMLLATLLITGQIQGQVSAATFWLLMISGAVGIGLGDTAYFESLSRLGIRLSLLLGILAPPLTAVMGMIFLGETLRPLAWGGIALTLAGVAWVITEQTASGEHPRRLWAGVAFGLLFALCQSGGAILSRFAFTQTTVTPLQSATIRLFAGVVALGIGFLIARQKIGGWMKVPERKKVWVWLLSAMIIGTYLAIWLQQVSFKMTEVAIAQTLLATSPLFGLGIGLIAGEKITLRSVVGVVLATVGIAMLFGLIG
ncbi:MAG TPA: DMT family transporter [Anaerolineaceae bacterium]|nr:DMT family transporter [Anaerolineaceae bacterium]HOG80455.1 DMT family transporter [Anaerolineaceae bacterium]HQF61027.1 DMT family transporter [Anaerolineaceae bacterium]HQH85085.1 DMT family transporter [Anaerolineaceae bacterium]